MTDKLSFLSGDEPAEHLDAPVIDPTPEPSVEAPQGAPARDEGGRFASPPTSEPAIAPEPAAEPVLGQPAPQPASDAAQVPLSVVHAERDKRQAAERELADLRKRTAPQRPVHEPQAPDRYEDPDGYEAFQIQQQQALVLNVKLDLSEDMARTRHTDEVVEAAKTWALQRFEQSPAYRQEVLGSRNPYEKAVQDYQRDQLVSQLQPDDFAAFQAWKAAQANPNPAPPSPAPPVTPATRAAPPIPPRSAAHAPSAGGPAHVASGPGQAFAAVFSKG